MAKKNKNKNKSQFVFVKVLQNGVVLAETQRPLHKDGEIFISNHHGDLILDLYHLPKDIEIVTIEDGSAHVNIGPNWNGFVTTRGKMLDYDTHHRKQAMIEMIKDDYASFAFGDLRLLVRVGLPHKIESKKYKKDKTYGGSLFKLAFPSAADVRAIATGAALSCAILIACLIGLNSLPNQKPASLEDLDPNYSLTFIHPLHLRYGPEALQTRVDRKQPVNAVTKYYRDVTKMLLGIPVSPSSALPPNSVELHRNIRARVQEEIEENIVHQDSVQSKQLKTQGRAMLIIPSVKGSSLTGTMNRIIDKLDIHHDALATNLDYRKRVSEAYRDDEGYASQKFKNVAAAKIAKEQLSKIQMVKIATPEENMYEEFTALAARAQFQQISIAASRMRKNERIEDNTMPIGIPAGIKYASFFNHTGSFSDDSRLDQIAGQKFGSKKVQKLKRLTGEINPNLISDVISKRKFELQICYELALRRDQQTKGLTEWSWVIDSRGEIADINLLSSSIRDRRMLRCIRKKLAQWRFPRPRNGSVRVRYPFKFYPAKG